MPMDAYVGSSDQSRCDIVATNSSALSPRDLLPLQLKVNLPLLQVEFDQIQTDERSQREELFVDKDTLRPRARAPSPWHSTHMPRHESNTRASGLRHDVFNRIGPLKIDYQAISPGSSAFNLGIPRTPERAYLALARTMVIQAPMEQAVAWTVMAPKMRKTGRQEANCIGTQGTKTCG